MQQFYLKCKNILKETNLVDILFSNAIKIIQKTNKTDY